MKVCTNLGLCESGSTQHYYSKGLVVKNKVSGEKRNIPLFSQLWKEENQSLIHLSAFVFMQMSAIHQ